MLQLSRKTDYGLRLMLEVAGSAPRSITTEEASRRQDIPYQFSRKVVQHLAARRLLVSERGFRGGLRLARPAERITLLDIVRSFEPPSLNCCTMDPPRCERRDVCPVYPVCVEAQRQVERVLGGTRLSDLAARRARTGRRSGSPALAGAGA